MGTVIQFKPKAINPFKHKFEAEPKQDFADRINRIKTSLESLNDLMHLIKQKEGKEIKR